MADFAWVFLMAAAVAMPNPYTQEHEAVLHAFSVGQGTVSISITDCSCTRPEDFRFEINRAGGDLRMVKVIRLRPDTCEAPDVLTTYEYSFEEIGLDEGTLIELKTPMKAFNRFSNADCKPIP